MPASQPDAALLERDDGFAEPVRLALGRDPALAAEIARRILSFWRCTGRK